MRPFFAMRVVAVAILALLAAGFTSQPSERRPDPPAGLAALAQRIPDLLPRLEGLAPSAPAAYFELAEEVASESIDGAGDLLARQLYVLAFVHDAPGPGATGLRAGACLGLARVERIEETRQWLIATAGRIDSRYAGADWSASAEPALTDDAALKSATVLGLIRAGEGLKALALMDDPEVRSTLRRYERLLGETGLTGGFDRLLTHARAWPCPECGNRRLVTRNTRQGPENRLCNTCLGNPGPRLAPAEFITHLRFESRLLNGIQRSWSAQIAADAGAPLLDPDPEQVPEVFRTRYGIQPSHAYFRAGQWVKSPG